MFCFDLGLNKSKTVFFFKFNSKYNAFTDYFMDSEKVNRSKEKVSLLMEMPKIAGKLHLPTR